MVTSPRRGYVLIILLVAILIMSIGLTVALPDWKTELQREREAELIFRGRQYVEAIRVFQVKNPGRFPKTLDELADERCIRKLYKDPMSPDGAWDVILNPGPSRQGRSGSAGQEVLVAPVSALGSIPNPVVLGVVSTSKESSVRLYEDQDTYDKWLFYLGHDPKTQPKITRLGREGKPMEEEKGKRNEGEED
jgi:type II secretory pathway pseudopilin PulG